MKNRVDRTVGPLGERALPNGRDMHALARVARDVASVANVEMLPVLPMPNWKLATLNLKIAVEQYPSCFFCRKERKEHKGGMFLLIIHAVRSVRPFNRLVPPPKKKRMSLEILQYSTIAISFAFFAAKNENPTATFRLKGI